MKKRSPKRPAPIRFDEILYIRIYNPELYTPIFIETEIIPPLSRLLLLTKNIEKNYFVGMDLMILELALYLCEHLEFLSIKHKKVARLVFSSIENFLPIYLDKNKAVA